MAVDLIDYWKSLKLNDNYHPDDEKVLRRLKGGFFNLKCLPFCFFGPLKTAPVVLLYLSPGLNQFDLDEARSVAGCTRVANARSGEQPIPAMDQHAPIWKWWKQRVKVFGQKPEELRSKIAVLNIGAYHSKSFDDYSFLASLPSSRVCLDWAQSVLFPQAMAGERVVICLRSAPFWGLKAGKSYGKTLFAPLVNRGGHMKNCAMRNRIVRAVHRAVSS
jgi:hypothetical protein